ncbi:hypothetical protein RJ035_000842 [Blastomyces gilchristii]
MAHRTQLVEMYGDLSNVDPQLVATLEKTHAEDPDYRELRKASTLSVVVPGLSTCSLDLAGMCSAPSVCGRFYTLANHANPPCVLCRSTNCDFRYKPGLQTISTDQSDFDRVRICLIIFFMKLQLLHGAWFNWNIKSDKYKVFDVDGNSDVENIQGIDMVTLPQLQGEEDYWAARPRIPCDGALF